MQRSMMKSKIHRATVTDANLAYMGSVTIDEDLMDAADLLPYERVHVLDINNGARLQTYVITGDRSSGTICLNGAAARLVQPGDKVIIISYGIYEESELTGHQPVVVNVDDRNHIAPQLAEVPADGAAVSSIN
ncbi:MAG: aspartate 1-decarboxylase [Actinomycetota bacterium]